MAYMDVKPAKPNGRTVVLLHGKNFCAATWEASIEALTEAGYRVIAPDQIGFCKSSKPEHYQYSFQQLAANTHALLASLGVNKATVIGPFDRRHAGGALCADVSATETEQLVLVESDRAGGLEGARACRRMSVDQWYRARAEDRPPTASATTNKRPITRTSGSRTTSPGCRCWRACIAGPASEIVAWNSALLYDMIYTQPVVYEFAAV